VKPTSALQFDLASAALRLLLLLRPARS